VPSPAETILVVDHNVALHERARRELNGVKVVENESVQGLSGARNSGLAAATGRIAVFMDDDAEADPDWLSHLIAPYADVHVIATGGRVVAAWPERRPRWMPEEFDWVVGCSYRGLPETEADIRNPIGCSMSVRRDDALRAGGFRSEMGRVGAVPSGCEETDLAIRLGRLMRGSRIVYEPAATVRHHVAPARTRWSYFWSRCYREGISKAILARLEGSSRALASERTYALKVLPLGVLRGVGTALGGDLAGILRAAAIVGGLYVTALGYLAGEIQARRLPPADAGASAASRGASADSHRQEPK